MPITDAYIRVYNDPDLQAEHMVFSGYAENDTYFHVIGLDPGSQFYANVQTRNEQQMGPRSATYTFTTLPQIQLTGYVTRSYDSFIRQTQITTDVVQVQSFGLEYDTDSSFSNVKRVDGNTVINLQEHTTYFYRPWLIDQYGREWINITATDTVQTLYNVPTVNWKIIYGADTTTFRAKINVQSLDTVSAVFYELTNTSTSITTTGQLTAMTGDQNILIQGLTPNTQYYLKIIATNSAGNGETTTEQFITEEATQAMTVNIIKPIQVNNTDNEIIATSSLTYNHNDITLISNDIEIYDNDLHTGSPQFYDIGGAIDIYTGTFNAAAPDTTYFIFGKATYTIGSDTTVFTSWSNPEEIRTYSLITIDGIAVNNTDVAITFSVAGSCQNATIDYSADEVTWTTIPIMDVTGETLQLTNLLPNTTYTVRARCESQAGWTAFVYDNFTTGGVSVLITGISNITSSGATVNIQINN